MRFSEEDKRNITFIRKMGMATTTIGAVRIALSTYARELMPRGSKK